MRFPTYPQRLLPLLLSSLLLASAPAAAQVTQTQIDQRPAVARGAAAATQPVLGAARAGDRIVTVGDRGTVLLSDDDGRTVRQAAAVPTRATLTAVAFTDARTGWAVGHWGVVLRTDDGGEHWTLQRSDFTVDQPLFSVHFADAAHGWAVGLWSLLLATEDGGRTWNPVTLPRPPDGGKADRNLYRVFSDAKGTLYIAAERGMVLRSADAGRSWTYLDTGYKGSFWAGDAGADGLLVVGGLRGTLYRSADGGRSWTVAKSDAKSSVTDLRVAGGKVFGVALDGVTLESADGGASYTARQRADRVPLTALALDRAGRPVPFSAAGVVRGE